MSLSCDCGMGDYDYYYIPPSDYSTLSTRRRQRCCSCGSLISVGATVAEYGRYRSPYNDIEERIYGDEVPLASKYHCEECADVFFSLQELGFCLTLGDSVKDLLEQYQEYVKEQAI